MMGNPAIQGENERSERTGRGPAEGRALWLERLTVTAFRNFAQTELRCDARPVVLLGGNGSGKTNLLEAISLLAPGRGLRRARLGDLSRRKPGNEAEGDRAWAVAARVHTPEGPRELGTGLDPANEAGRERRLLKLDGEFVSSQQAFGEIVSAVWVAPHMDRIFQESPSSRRRFLDRLVYGFDPAHAGRIAAYEHAMRERSRLLREQRRDPSWLGGLERTMAEKAVAIAAARRSLVSRLAAACEETHGAFPAVGLALVGDAESWLDEMPAVQVEERLLRRLEESRPADGETGGAACGAHRCDLAASDLERDMPAAFCSTGEQKALLLSLVMAHTRLLSLERGTGPLLLLDEVAAHLDAGLREALYASILDLGVQAWMSGTDSGLFSALGPDVQRFHLREGLVLREA
ncbi:DNA replication/repair protein RecF [Fodinicurvata halophila]|uniref:DNA replication and repair protein RecF n=2 Tax=Fodinicurvata halophila TaxID=1419723 RepID=A0ABV8UFM9_9PROT